MIDLPFLYQAVLSLEEKVLKRVKECRISKIWEYLNNYIEEVERYMGELNYLEYEYSLLIG